MLRSFFHRYTNHYLHDKIAARLKYIMFTSIKEYFEEDFHEHRCLQSQWVPCGMIFIPSFLSSGGSICLFVKFSPMEVIYNFRVYNWGIKHKTIPTQLLLLLQMNLIFYLGTRGTENQSKMSRYLSNLSMKCSFFLKFVSILKLKPFTPQWR